MPSCLRNKKGAAPPCQGNSAHSERDYVMFSWKTKKGARPCADRAQCERKKDGICLLSCAYYSRLFRACQVCNAGALPIAYQIRLLIYLPYYPSQSAIIGCQELSPAARTCDDLFIGHADAIVKSPGAFLATKPSGQSVAAQTVGNKFHFPSREAAQKPNQRSGKFADPDSFPCIRFNLSNHFPSSSTNLSHGL